VLIQVTPPESNSKLEGALQSTSGSATSSTDSKQLDAEHSCGGPGVKLHLNVQPDVGNAGASPIKAEPQIVDDSTEQVRLNTSVIQVYDSASVDFTLSVRDADIHTKRVA
jgi:hypothetical protein